MSHLPSVSSFRRSAESIFQTVRQKKSPAMIALHPFTAYMPSDLAHFRRMGRTKHKKIEENERTGSFRKKNRMQEGRMRREAKNGKERHALQKGRGKDENRW